MTNPPKGGCAKGCLVTSIIGIAILMVFGIIEDFNSANEWKKKRVDVLASIEQAVDRGDYERAFSLADPHKSRNDAELKQLVSRAESLKQETEERARQTQISELVAEIKSTKGSEREAKLKQLISLDPDTKEFPEEILEIRERPQKLKAEAENFVSNGVGKKVPYEKWSIVGSPETLDSTNNKYWVAYLPDIDVSFVSEKASHKVIFAGYGKRSAPDYLANKDAARKKRLEGGFSAWDGSNWELTKLIKNSMNDPGSYEHVKTAYWDMGDHLVVRTTFRGKNAFGGIVKNWVKAKTDLDGNVVEIMEQGQ